jgi:hypothetical protein
MILMPALAGGGLAVATAFGMLRWDLIQHWIVGWIVVVVAAFWPVFALTDADHGHGSLTLHLTLLAAFAGTALFARRIGFVGLGIVLMSHGLLDALLSFTDHPGPLWWPAFCAAYDVVFGAFLIFTPRFADLTS